LFRHALPTPPRHFTLCRPAVWRCPPLAPLSRRLSFHHR
jgi:hypothetical protein